MNSKVSWTAKIKPLFYGGKDDKRVLFCRPALVWKEAVYFLRLFFDRPRDLAPLVFEVCNVDLDGLLERAAFVLFPFSGVPLSASPACWYFPCEGLQSILCRSGADLEVAIIGGPDLVVG